MIDLDDLIDTDALTFKIRQRIILPNEQKVLIAFLNDSQESKDKYTKINCKGYGRLRIYRNYTLHLPTKFKKIPNSPKPLLRGHYFTEKLRTQVFQLAGCNWRCWYCFVDFALLSGDLNKGKFFSANELLDLYLEEDNPPNVLDLSGGQPDIVPEWTLWMMKALQDRGLMGKVYVWVDDNLSNRYLWKYLTKEQIDFIAKFPLSSRVGCFKGFDENSFSFNTKASSNLFIEQFSIFKALLDAGFDMYAYVTFTTISLLNVEVKMSTFVDDNLQKIHPKLPLRTIPLKIVSFSANRSRENQLNIKSIALQNEVMYYWSEELEKRFDEKELRLPASEIVLR